MTGSILPWLIPTSVRVVRSFVGLASYYRRFIQYFATIASPLHRLAKSNGPYVWTAEAQQSFDKFKTVLTPPSILALTTDCDELILDIDESNSAIGDVVSQRQDGVERVVAYASRVLDKKEQNYCATRKELLAVVHFVLYFKQYLLGRTFKLRIDHAALSWLRHTLDPIGQQVRWLEQLEEYDFTIEHHSGIRHGNADAMSRRPCNRRECACHGDGVAVPTTTHESNEHEVRRVRTRQQARKERHTSNFLGGPADHQTPDTHDDESVPVVCSTTCK
jgi:hypothetical protein